MAWCCPRLDAFAYCRSQEFGTHSGREGLADGDQNVSWRNLKPEEGDWLQGRHDERRGMICGWGFGEKCLETALRK